MDDNSDTRTVQIPLVLAEHDPRWAQWFADEAGSLKDILGDIRLHHIGSTAVDGILSRPIVDMLIVFDNVALMYICREKLLDHGYESMCQSGNRITLCKGYGDTSADARRFNLYLRMEGDDDEIYFCEYLKHNPAVAMEYSDLKVHLSELYKEDPEWYTRERYHFVRRYTELGRSMNGI